MNRRISAIGPAMALGLTLAIVLLSVLLADRTRSRSRRVTLGVGEVMALNGTGGERLRLVALSTGLDGRRTLFLESQPDGGPSAAYRLLEGKALEIAGVRLMLGGVALDSARGEAVQLQWLPREESAPRPLFSATEEPVPLPALEGLTVRVVGPIPPPGPGTLVLEVRREDGAPITGTLEWGGRLPVGDDGDLTWIGTRERWLVSIDCTGPTGQGARDRGIIPRS